MTTIEAAQWLVAERLDSIAFYRHEACLWRCVPVLGAPNEADDYDRMVAHAEAELRAWASNSDDPALACAATEALL